MSAEGKSGGFRFGSLFSGGGLADVGLVAAGGVPVFAVEIDDAAAGAYEANLGPHVIRRSVTEVDPHSLEPVDLLWCSPPCPGYSVARSRALGAHGSEELGLAVIPYLEVLRPRVFLLENVPPYASSPAFKQIVAALYRLGYMVDWSNINAADCGVPQTRNRLYLRAVRDALLPPLPAPVPWVGWYQAIEDLLPTLPESAFAPWQLQRLAGHRVYDDFLLMTGNTQMAMPTGTGILEAGGPANTMLAGSTAARAFLLHPTASHSDTFPVRGAHDPACTILAGMNAPRAFLVSGTDALVREEAAPCVTLTGTLHEHTALPRAFLVDGQNAGRPITSPAGDRHAFTLPTMNRPAHVPRAGLADGRVVSMTPRALARFMSVPDNYVLSERKADACRVLGNGVPCLVAQRLAEGLRNVIEGDG